MPAAPITAIGTQWAPQQLRQTATSLPPSLPVSPSVSLSFAPSASEVPAARRFVRDTLADHPASLDAELLACELVTNAVQHAQDAAEVTVSVLRSGPTVHVDVIDDGRAGLPHWREASGDDENGRGFHLVNEIAHRWGFVREPAGTCVWFEVMAV
jgi:anti-sigma regulatory factor (Ser/Thr protein kinase)